MNTNEKRFELWDKSLLWTGTLQELIDANQDDPIPEEVIENAEHLEIGESCRAIWFTLKRIK